MQRRTVLAGVGAGLLATAGCIGLDGNEETDDSAPADQSENASTADESDDDRSDADDGDEFDPDIDPRYLRGAASPANLEFEPHEPTDDLTAEDHEYNETAEVVHIEYENTTGEMEFDEFAQTRSRRAVQRDLRQRFDDAGIDQPPRVNHVQNRRKERLRRSDLDIDFEAYDVVVQVSHLTVFDGDGNKLYEPDESFETVVDLVPASYETHTSFAGYEHVGSIAVVCFRGAQRETED